MQLVGRNHKVVGRLIIDKQLAIAVIDEASGRVLRHIAQHVVRRRHLIRLVNNLQKKQAANVYQEDKCEQSSNHKTPLAERIHLLRTNKN